MQSHVKEVKKIAKSKSFLQFYNSDLLNNLLNSKSVWKTLTWVFWLEGIRKTSSSGLSFEFCDPKTWWQFSLAFLLTFMQKKPPLQECSFLKSYKDRVNSINTPETTTLLLESWADQWQYLKNIYFTLKIETFLLYHRPPISVH